MPKQKVHKGVKKRRMRVTRRGKVVRRRAGATHLMSGKSGKKRRGLRRPTAVVGGEAKRAKRLLGSG